MLGKEFAVDIGELAEFLVEVALALRGVGVEDAKELFQPDTEIRAVLGGAVAEEQFKGFLREDAVVLGKETEEDADEKAFEFVAGIAARFQSVMHVAHELRGFEVGGVFGIEPVLGVAGDKREVADEFVEVGQREFDGGRQAQEQRRVRVLLRLQIVEGNAREIRDDQPAGNLAVAPGVLEAADVVHALGVGLVESGPGGLVLGEQAGRPEQVNEAPIAGELFYRLFEGGDGAATDAEDVEELVPKGLALGGFAGFALPFLGKSDGPVANLVP